MPSNKNGKEYPNNINNLLIANNKLNNQNNHLTNNHKNTIISKQKQFNFNQNYKYKDKVNKNINNQSKIKYNHYLIKYKPMNNNYK